MDIVKEWFGLRCPWRLQNSTSEARRNEELSFFGIWKSEKVIRETRGFEICKVVLWKSCTVHTWGQYEEQLSCTVHWESFPLLFCSTQQLTNLLNSFESLFSWERGALLALPFSALSFLFLSFSVPLSFFTKPWMPIGHRPKSDTRVFREFSKENEFLQRPIFLSSNI